ncbi:MAG TPA: Hsp20/alpha crystallin family protein [Gaiellaceae bacterium]|jgi:HSP20 family protein|nr:Hsp20/alpha crystallin family protein [Gaiellaceae bacterium]
MQHAGLARGLPPHANVSECADEYVIELELSDFAEPELTVELDGNRVSVCGEQFETDDEASEPFRLRERLVESFNLPADVDRNGVVAYFEHGLLEIHAPRACATSPRRIPLRRREHGLLHPGAEAV